ncbi:MAG: helix-turn-helix domain-containing protein [Conexibacter sp.]
MTSRPSSFAEQLRRVREARGLSRNLLSHRTARVGEPGISPAGIEALERNPDRQPTDRTVLILGDALGASDEEFPAYALARARALFSERIQGEDRALANLRRLKRCL